MVELAARPINLMLTSYQGLGLEPTSNFVISRQTTWHDFFEIVKARIKDRRIDLCFTSLSNRTIQPSSDLIATTVENDQVFSCLRLSARLRGGKGGFGSQLRAAGGRMSSRKKKADNSEARSSNRNLDGRRIRTVHQAKVLVEYLANLPAAEQTAKQEQRQKWEHILSTASKAENENKDSSKGRLNESWIDDRDDSEAKVRDAMVFALQTRSENPLPESNLSKHNFATIKRSTTHDQHSHSELREDCSHSKHSQQRFTGFDVDEAFLSEHSSDDAELRNSQHSAYVDMAERLA